MSVSGSRAAVDFNLEEFERRLRAAASFPTGSEDPLFELARLVESSKSETSIRPAAELTKAAEAERLERAAMEEGVHHEIVAEDETSQHSVVAHADEQAWTEEPAVRRRIGWTGKVAALAVAGVAMIGAVFVLKGGLPGLPKHPPYIAATQGPTKVAPPSGDTVSAANDAGANLLKDNTQSAHVKVVASQEQPVDLTALASTAAAAPADVSAGVAVKATVDTPVVVMTPAPPPPRQQFPDPKPVRTVSLRPDGTPIAMASAEVEEAAPAVEAGKAPLKPAPKATTTAAAVAQPSTPRLELPTKLSGKSSARVAVAKTDTTAPSSIAEALNEPLQPGSAQKLEKAPKTPKTQAAAADPAATSAPAPTVDPAAATKSSGWSVQLAAPRSEVDANSEMSRLNVKYASALNGSSIGVQKAVIKGETIYRLRVVGLSKADAAALCARLKGDGGECFIAK